MDLKDALEKLKDNPELAQKLEEAIKNKADAQEFYGILIEGGVAAEAADAAMAEYQRKRGLSIADEGLDEEALKKVAGGGCGTSCSQADDCDSNYKDPRYWDEDRCDYVGLCDEVFYLS